MENTIKQLIEIELVDARIKFPEFNSSHEGFNKRSYSSSCHD